MAAGRGADKSGTGGYGGSIDSRMSSIRTSSDLSVPGVYRPKEDSSSGVGCVCE
jgi:hypothetical protein